MPLFKILVSSALKAFLYKNYTLASFSIAISIGLEYVANLLKLQFFGVSYSFLLLATILIIVDFTTGMIASRYVQKSKKGWFKSEKVPYTVSKFTGMFLLLWLSNEAYQLPLYLSKVNPESYWGAFVNIVGFARNTAFFLICGREFVSIGENIETRYGKKPYVFKFFSKLLDLIELKFWNKLKKEE